MSSMEKQHELEWNEAQRIRISADLVSVAKQQLRFLSAVDRSRSLFEGPVLLRAIHRYNACWLPLLAKHSKKPVCEGPLVVPLDCEWVWHCHRLNPVRYKSDCEELFGEILDNRNVVSTVEKTSKTETEDIWRALYPEEPYIVDLTISLSEDISGKIGLLEKYTEYDLVSAVKRQVPFFFQVSRPHMSNDEFLEGALARYRGFLHLIRRNRERSLKRFCVPTYDIDLLWHSHQLNPAAYCEDLTQLIGKVLEHDDTDSDRTKGMKLDVGFSGTTKQFENTFGRRYWKAGAMYRGSTPAPVTSTPFSSRTINNKNMVSPDEFKDVIQVPEAKSVQVFLEFVEVRNLPEGHKGNLTVSFSKTQPDILFDATRKLTISSESKAKQVSSFNCEPTGELLFELFSYSPFALSMTKAPKTLGTASLVLNDLLAPNSNLYREKWLDLAPKSGNLSSNPIQLRVAASITIPVSAERVIHMVHSRPSLKISCLLPFPGVMKDEKSKTQVIDEAGNKLISLQMIRNPEKAKGKENNLLWQKKVTGFTSSGEKCDLAEYVGNGWSLMKSQWSLNSCNNPTEESPLFELLGTTKTVKFYRGRKLEYETRQCRKHRNELDFITAVEFSTETPYGKAIAVINLKSGLLKVKEEWMVIPSIISFMILSDMVKDHYDSFSAAPGIFSSEPTETTALETDQLKKENLKSETQLKGVSGGCGAGGCGGGGCGSAVNSGGCGGGGCGGGVNSGGCGGCGAGGCGGGGCGGAVNSGGCGGCGAGGCGGGGCGGVNSGGCGGCGAGGCGGGGCGGAVNSGGCGGCGAGGCGGGVSGGGVKSGGCGGCGAGGCGGGIFAVSETNNVTVVAVSEPIAA